MADIHKHQCSKCGTIWEHDGDTLDESLSFDEYFNERWKMHLCPECKNPQFKRTDDTWET